MGKFPVGGEMGSNPSPALARRVTRLKFLYYLSLHLVIYKTKKRIVLTHLSALPRGQTSLVNGKPNPEGSSYPGNRKNVLLSFVSFCFLGLQVAEAAPPLMLDVAKPWNIQTAYVLLRGKAGGEGGSLVFSLHASWRRTALYSGLRFWFSDLKPL